jgi:hypothetical protein
VGEGFEDAGREDEDEDEDEEVELLLMLMYPTTGTLVLLWYPAALTVTE